MISVRDKQGMFDRIEAKREQMGLSISSFAKKTCISRQMWHAYSRGKTPMTWDTLFASAETVGINPRVYVDPLENL
jgi:transcriptional regulator with XRE-family HTH domain